MSPRTIRKRKKRGARRLPPRRLRITGEKLAPATRIAGEGSAQRAGALQVRRSLSSGREGTVPNDDHLRVSPDASLVADWSRDVLHQRLEVLAADAGLA